MTYRDVPAFPHVTYYGLTKREYFAAQALAGILANATGYSEDYDDTAKEAVLRADALIKELNR